MSPKARLLLQFAARVTAAALVFIFFFLSPLLADSTDVPLYPRTEFRLYGMTLWDEQIFHTPLTQATWRHREKSWFAWAKYDLDQNKLVEMTGAYKPYRWLALQTGQFRTPVGHDIPPSEYHLFTVVPVSDIVPHTYDRGAMAIISTDHTTTMVAGVNGEGYTSVATDNETDVVYRLSGRIKPVSASYSRQVNSRRHYSAGSIMVRDPYLTVVFTKAMRAGDFDATVYQLQLVSRRWSGWGCGVQFSRFSKHEFFQRGSVSVRITTEQSITDFAVERWFGGLSRVRIEYLPFDGADDQWRITAQHGFVLNR